MKQEDLQQIVKALNENTQQSNEKGKIIDWLFKALIGVIVWIGIGLRNDVDVLKTDVQKMSSERIYSERDMEAFRDFIAEPRFTRDNYDNLITPIKSAVDKNTLELNDRAPLFLETEKRLLKIEYNLEEIIERIESLE